MNTQGLNLFIVDDNQIMATQLRNYLENKFGVSLIISTFFTGESALKKIDEHTDIVILDYHLKGENGNDVLVAIKTINPKTEVIMLSSNEDIAIAIESFRNGAADYVIKGRNSLSKIYSVVYNIISYPLRHMVREWGFSRYFAIFILTFSMMGIIVLFIVKYVPFT